MSTILYSFLLKLSFTKQKESKEAIPVILYFVKRKKENLSLLQTTARHAFITITWHDVSADNLTPT